jgi:hypothetical protein
MPETTSATLADMHSAAATAPARLHRTAAAAASHVAPGAADMHPTTDMHRATDMHPGAATTTSSAMTTTATLGGERNGRDQKTCCNCRNQRRLT